MEISPLSSQNNAFSNAESSAHLKKGLHDFIQILNEVTSGHFDPHQKSFRQKAAGVILEIHKISNEAKHSKNESIQDTAITASNILNFPLETHPSLIHAAQKEAFEEGATSPLSLILQEMGANPHSTEYMKTEIQLAVKELH